MFDVASAWKGVVFKLDQHVDRFFQSLQATRIDTRLTKAERKQVILDRPHGERRHALSAGPRWKDGGAA